MDSSHVSLCAIVLKAEGFDFYRCDKSFALGVNTPNLAKILKCAGNDDLVTLKCEEGSDTLTLVFQSPAQDRISDFDFKLMDIESEHLGIPDTEYKCTVRMPSAEFQRIIRDISVFGDTCEHLLSIYPPTDDSPSSMLVTIRLHRGHEGRHPVLFVWRPGHGQHHAEE